MTEQPSSLRRILAPYLAIAVAGLLAFAPVSFMLRSLKNDIIALEYPINYFMSQSVRHGEIPYWFNTWGMGFPLQSNITWGMFSTPQVLFSSAFHYNIYILHIEFMFFVLLAGWGMFHLLSKYVIKDRSLAQLLAIAYMLSGFMVGSTQWLLYITAAAFLPLVTSGLLKLLQAPTAKNAFQFAVLYAMMFTSVYAAFTIIATYSLALFCLVYLLQNRPFSSVLLRHLSLAVGFTLLLCVPCLYYTAEVLQHIDRGSAITSDTSFFNSNYLHPSALSSMLLPFSSVRMSFPNTEGTMLNTYAGLFVLLLLPAAIQQWIRERRTAPAWMLGTAALFLLLSFGAVTPLRSALNVLPGFSYFRNPAIFRLFFLFGLAVFLAITFKERKLVDLFSPGQNKTRRTVLYTIALLIILTAATAILPLRQPGITAFHSISSFLKDIRLPQAILVSAAIQFILLFLLLGTIQFRRWNLMKFIFIADLVINTLICTPFFSVGNYSVAEVDIMLHGVKGFPVQQKSPADVAAVYTDDRMNKWNNVNVFSKEVSSHDSYRGPLVLEQDTSAHSSPGLFLPLASLKNTGNGSSVKLLLQRPNHVRAEIDAQQPDTITLLQNDYPGWKASYNDQAVALIKTPGPGIHLAVPKGKAVIDFRYRRNGPLFFALLLHLAVITYLTGQCVAFFKKKRYA